MYDRKYVTLIIVVMTAISIILVVVSTGTSDVYAQNQTKYKSKLGGDNVVPPVNTTASGRVVIFIGNDWLWWKLNVTGINEPTMAHIHMGENGVNGAVVADLLKSANFENSTERMIITGNISAADLQGPLSGKTIADLQSAINALGVNIDLHTKNHPEGELRGTIRIQES